MSKFILICNITENDSGVNTSAVVKMVNLAEVFDFRYLSRELVSTFE